MKDLIRAGVHRVRGWANALTGPVPVGLQPTPGPSPRVGRYQRLQRVRLTDQVSRTLFTEYAEHRASARGDEETGWVLLGLREADEAIVLATLPAGANRDAGEAHVRFNATAQALASRIVRQRDRRLTLLGVVHTHPGKLRHPSHGDYQGDRIWVQNLRGEEGVFAIGTAQAEPEETTLPVARKVGDHAQTLAGLRFDWYTLAAGDRTYQPVAVDLTIGPDLATPLRPIWGVIEEHAERLDRLARQLTSVRFEPTAGKDGTALAVTIGLGEPGQAIRVLLEKKTERYFYEAGGEAYQADLPAGVAPDQGVYLLLAELAARR